MYTQSLILIQSRPVIVFRHLGTGEYFYLLTSIQDLVGFKMYPKSTLEYQHCILVPPHEAIDYLLLWASKGDSRAIEIVRELLKLSLASKADIVFYSLGSVNRT